MPENGLNKIHKDVVAYCRRLIREGWTELDPDPAGNPRYAWPTSPGVLTLPRGGRGRWRQDADKLVSSISGTKSHRGQNQPRVLKAVQDQDDLRIAEAGREAATARNLSEQQRRRLMAEEDRFNSIRRLMSARPGSW